MYPKNTSDVDSGVPCSKEETFMDRVYLKMEAICVEADKNLIQGASKYVETQVSTVSSNVKKLCSDFLRDLLPPPEEDLKECRHVEKCKCKAGCESQNSHAQTDAPEQDEVTDAPAQGTDTPPQVTDDPATVETNTTDDNGKVAKTRQVSCCSEVVECDAIVEEGDQIARWYEGRNTIFENIPRAETVELPKASDKSSGSDNDDWEIL